jgi:hypothetical protein
MDDFFMRMHVEGEVQKRIFVIKEEKSSFHLLQQEK